MALKIIELLRQKNQNLYGAKPVTIAFLGDSVTQGCFELYQLPQGGLQTYFERDEAYSEKLRSMLQTLYPAVQVNIINSGISGDSAPNGLNRMERDIFPYSPDLLIVCYGLNDSGAGQDGLARYTDALRGIFAKCHERGLDVIFMTPNMMNTYVSLRDDHEMFTNIAASVMHTQNDGVMDAYMDAARQVAAEADVPVCDCYAKWKRLADAGVDTTFLLANNINHPSREMHWLFAWSLLEEIFFK